MTDSPTKQLAALVAEMRDDLADSEARGRQLAVSATSLVFYYQTMLARFGPDVALHDARLRHARQFACAIDALPRVAPSPSFHPDN